MAEPEGIVAHVRASGVGIAPQIDAFINAVTARHGRVFLRDPTVWSQGGYASDKIEVVVAAAHDEDDARAILRSIIDQLPGVGTVITVL